MTIQTKIHDGLIAVLILLSVVLATQSDLRWLWLAVAVCLVMISSLFTGFCPIHYTVNKVLPPK